jgi:signal transduction histidine kinase
VPLARDEVGRLAETMNEMLGRLEAAQGVQRRFVADASHELRSPLATIAAGLELLQDGSSMRDSDVVTVVALRGEAERLHRLVEALLLLARADERGLQPRRDEVDLDDVAEAERVRPGAGGVPAEVHADPVRVIGDRGQLARVVRNLVDNARRHASTRVLVTVRRDGGDAVVEVSDDGPGVPVAERGRVFERFVRLDDARARSDGGSGLGLAIVAEVAAAHDGSVEIDDAPGGGALFRVRLPAVMAADLPSGPIPRPVGLPPAPRPVPRPLPVRDGDARRDPPTTPHGIPVALPSHGCLPAGQSGSDIR